MVLGSDFIYARCFHHQRLATTENFARMKIQWICFSFDDILLERICLNMASRLKKEFGKKPQNVLSDIRYDGYKHWVIP